MARIDFTRSNNLVFISANLEMGSAAAPSFRPSRDGVGEEGAFASLAA